MVFRITLTVAIAALTVSASAQTAPRNAVQRQFAPQQRVAQQQFVQPQIVQPQMHAQQMAPGQYVQPMAPSQYGQPNLPGQGVLTNQGQYQNYQPVIGSGLPSAQKDGCNCFQMPPVDTTPKYDPYASKNYWTDICPNGQCGGGCPTGGCRTPKYDFNRFIPRPTQRMFRW